METHALAPDSYVDVYRGWSPGLFGALLDGIAWESKAIKIFGREVMQPRLVAWYGAHAYTYSGAANEPLLPTPTLFTLMRAVRATVGQDFNSVLCNLYRDGRDSIGMHSDDEPEMGAVIASLSAGATRRFVLTPKKGVEGLSLKLDLADGDLLVMRGRLQETHKHGVPKQLLVRDGRINLTFRYASV